MQILTDEVLVARQKEFIDGNGAKWITPARVAEIWNEKAQSEHDVAGRYTRWSVYQRRADFKRKLATPNGELYTEEEARGMPLRPHPKGRPDITNNRKGKKKQEIDEMQSRKSPGTDNRE